MQKARNMQNDFFAGLEVFSGIALPLILSMAASLARLARHGWPGIKTFLGNSFLSAFTSILVFWGLDYWDFPPTVDAAIIGASAYAAVELLQALVDRLAMTARESGPIALSGKGKMR